MRAPVTTLRVLAALAGITVAAFLGGAVPAHSTGGGAITASSPCGSMATQTPNVTKVMVVMMENHGYSQIIGSPEAPQVNALAHECGLATNYHALQYPSLPNYVKLTAGRAPSAIAGNGSVGSDCHPGGTCVSTDPSIFSQVSGAGKTWRSYVESMPANCSLTDAYPYMAKHNPAAYFVTPAQRTDCQHYDVPLGTLAGGNLAGDVTGGTLPNFSLVVPNMCNDGHDSCAGKSPVAEEDAFVKSWLATIVAGPDYQSGHLTVVLTWDSDSNNGTGNHVATVVMSPYTPAGTVSSTTFDHYSLLRSTEQLLSLGSYLGGASSATDMLAAFHLAPGSTGGNPPATPVLTDHPSGSTTSTSAMLSFTDATSGAAFRCSFDGSAFSGCTSPVDYSGLAVGAHSFAVEAANSYGTSGAATATWTVTSPSTDTTPPSVPAHLAATQSGGNVALTWSASTDPDDAVGSYLVYRHGVQIGTATGTSFTDSSLPSGGGGVVDTASFGSAQSSGWGAGYTVAGGGSASVTGGAGRLSLTGAVQSEQALYQSTVSSTGELMRFSFGARPVGGLAYMTVVGRSVSSLMTGDSCRLYVQVSPTGAIMLGARRTLAGVTTTVGTPVTLPTVLVPGVAYDLRVQFAGSAPTTLRARLWPATAGEPSTWQFSALDSSPTLQHAGLAGVRLVSGAAFASKSLVATIAAYEIDDLATGTTTYAYTVRARDTHGNTSAASTAVDVVR
jgi:phosphatidylinositol-3-phosphatase